MLMFYCRRASPKHHYDMTEVEYGGGGTAHGWERSTDQLVCLEVPPAPIYKGATGEVAGLGGGRAKGGVLLPPGVGLLLPMLE